MSNKTWAILICALLLVSAGLSAFFMAGGEPAVGAEIYSGGELIAVVDLRQDQQLTIPWEDGFNTITIKDGKIAVTDADCPDRFCISEGFRSSGPDIVCLPHRLVIRFTGPQAIDAVTG